MDGISKFDPLDTSFIGDFEDVEIIMDIEEEYHYRKVTDTEYDKFGKIIKVNYSDSIVEPRIIDTVRMITEDGKISFDIKELAEKYPLRSQKQINILL